MTTSEHSEVRVFVLAMAKTNPQAAFAFADKMGDKAFSAEERTEWRKLALKLQQEYFGK